MPTASAQEKVAAHRPRGRRGRGLDVKPELLREARQRAGLTMEQLAGDELTRGAIYMFESGRARPSRQVLEMIAAKTGHPVSYFVSGLPGTEASADAIALIANLERLVAAGAEQEALQVAESVDPRELTPSVALRFQLAVARAALMVKHVDAALVAADEARRLVEAVGDAWLAAQVGLVQAEVLHAAEDPGAGAVAQRTLDEVRALDRPPPFVAEQLQLLLAQLAEEAGDAAQAAAGYEAVADERGDAELLRQVAEAVGQGGAWHESRGDKARAAQEYERSTAYFALYRFLSIGVDAQLRLARVRFTAGEDDQAYRALDRAAQAASRRGLPRHECRAVLTMAEVAVRRGAVDEAHRLVDLGAELADQLTDRQGRGMVHLLRGQLLARAGEHQGAAEEFQAALDDFEATGCAHRLMATRAAYAEMLEERGDLREALEQWKLATGFARPDLRQHLDVTNDWRGETHPPAGQE